MSTLLFSTFRQSGNLRGNGMGSFLHAASVITGFHLQEAFVLL